MAAGAPSIIGEFGENYHDRAAGMSSLGAFQSSTTTAPTMTATARSEQSPRGWIFKASRSSNIYGNSSTITPLSQTCRLLIKY